VLNLAAVLDHHVRRYPDKVVITHGDRRVTNRELYARVNSLAAGLQNAGVRPGDIVALLLTNCPEFIESLLAVNRIGAALLPLNVRLSAAEWQYNLEHSQAAAIISEPEFQSKIDNIVPSLPNLATRVLLGTESREPWLALEQLIADNKGIVLPAAAVAENHLHRLVYTSGTTSRPKGVPLTHGNVHWKTLSHLVEFGITGEDVALVCGPLYHVGGLDIPALTVWYAGGSLVIMRKFDAVELVATIERERPTQMWLATAMLNMLLQLPDVAERDLSSLRLVIFGGERTPKAMIDRCLSAIPNAWISDGYGSTETCSGDAFNDAAHALSKAGSVGRPVLHLDLKIVDDNGSEVAIGKTGEVAIRGPKVFSGYWRDEAATAKVFRDGWFLTGDIGRLDEDGYLYIEDRKKDMIISGGENISSSEVERVLYEHPHVLEAAVVAMQHTRWGEVPKAFVVLKVKNSLDTAVLREFCAQRLAKFKIPQEIVFVEALPRTASGKVLKRVLRDGFRASGSGPL
jgi:O-succinylbenzoate-CoA ligase